MSTCRYSAEEIEQETALLRKQLEEEGLEQRQEKCVVVSGVCNSVLLAGCRGTLSESG